MNITIKIAGEEKVVRLAEAVGKAEGDISLPLKDFGERLVRKIGRRLAGNPLKSRTGRLKSSLTYDATPHTLTVSAGGKDEVRYAGIHHHGGEIRPKNKKALAIPFPGGPADKRVPLRPSDFINTFVAKGIIFQRTARSSRYGLANARNIVPLFILRKSVTLPERPYMFVEDSDVRYLKKSIGGYITGKWK